MTAFVLTLVGGLIGLVVVTLLLARHAIRRLRRFVRAFWPHS
jgi:hypothetical protein